MASYFAEIDNAIIEIDNVPKWMNQQRILLKKWNKKQSKPRQYIKILSRW